MSVADDVRIPRTFAGETKYFIETELPLSGLFKTATDGGIQSILLCWQDDEGAWQRLVYDLCIEGLLGCSFGAPMVIAHHGSSTLGWEYATAFFVGTWCIEPEHAADQPNNGIHGYFVKASTMVEALEQIKVQYRPSASE